MCLEGTGEQKVSTRDISDVVKVLRNKERKNLYEKLGLSPVEIEDAEAEGGNAPDLKGKSVLRHWVQKNGNMATRNAILTALRECEYKSAIQGLQQIWGIHN